MDWTAMVSDTPKILSAPLRAISLGNLLDGVDEEVEQLVLAAREDGMFYLDFAGHASSQFPGLVDEIYSLSRSLFGLGLEEKLRYDVDKIGMFKLNGYKPINRNVGGLPGQRDGFESYAIPCDGLYSPPDKGFPRPAPVDEHWHTMQSFTRSCRDVADIIFQKLSKALHLPAEKTIESFHRPYYPSLDIIRLLKYEAASPGDITPCVPQTAHTDMGSLTMLFASTPGLQICPKGSEDWLYVMPRENSVVVNLGDAMTIWTDGMFQSVLHRVSSMPGQEMRERYSFAFLMRPAKAAPMASLMQPSQKGSETEALRCDDWVRAKFSALRGQKTGGSKDADVAVLTGRDRGSLCVKH